MASPFDISVHANVKEISRSLSRLAHTRPTTYACLLGLRLMRWIMSFSRGSGTARRRSCSWTSGSQANFRMICLPLTSLLKLQG